MMIRRRGLFRGFGFGEWAWRRSSSSSSMATQARPPTHQTNNNNSSSSSTRERERERERIPLLMVSCYSAAARNPESRSLYRLTKDDTYHITNLEWHRNLTLHGISTNDYYLAGSSRGFLFFWPRSGGHIRAIHPITGAHFRLPPVAADPDYEPQPCCFTPNPNKMKIILSPSLDTAVLLCRQAQFTRLPSTEWTSFPLINMAKDFIFHKNRLYVVEPYDTVLAFDEDDFATYSPSADLPLSDTWSLDKSPMSRAFIHMTYFMESPDGNDIFLLFRCLNGECGVPHGTGRWWVYKLDDDGDDWKPIDSIGDSAFFVGQHGVMSLPVSRDGPSVLEPDSIYFTDDEYYSPLWPQKGLLDTGIYSLRYGTAVYLHVADTGKILDYSPSVWLPSIAC